MQLAPEGPGQPMGHQSYVPAMYAYDVAHRSGVADITIKLQDLEALTMPFVDMADAIVCPVSTGACVSSTTGGVVKGFDMYGQYIEETVGAAGTSTIAFASVHEAPADAAWANQFGLPYAYAGAAPNPNADVTFTAPAADEDARGTFAYGGSLAAPVEVAVPYLTVRDNLMGDPYAPRFATTDREAETTMAATIDNTGAIAITKTLIADDSAVQVYTFPDGGTVVTDNAAEALNYTLSPLWMSKYAKQVVLEAVKDTLVSGSTPAGTSIKVNLTGDLV